MIDEKKAQLQGLKDGGLIADFEVICDETNNTPEDIEAGKINVGIKLHPAAIHTTIETKKPSFVCAYSVLDVHHCDPDCYPNEDP